MNGICKNCGCTFTSRNPKKYCTMKCYTTDPETVGRLRRMNESRKNQAKTKCLECGKEYVEKASRNRKFCNFTCRSIYLSKRFDRFVASPTTFKNMQCFDEFFLLEELPCLVDGCEWVGHSLSMHMNMVHGIPATEFKQKVGFSATSGIVSRSLRETLVSRDHSVQIKNLNAHRPVQVMRKLRKVVSLEGKERILKARALRTEDNFKKELICEYCNEVFIISGRRAARQKFCSVKCRSKNNRETSSGRLTCSNCGLEFLGNRAQGRRVLKGVPVCCSMMCRQVHNAANKK